MKVFSRTLRFPCQVIIFNSALNKVRSPCFIHPNNALKSMAAFKRITVLSDCFSSLTGSQLSEPLQLLTGWQYPEKLNIAKLDTNKINLSICFYFTLLDTNDRNASFQSRTSYHLLLPREHNLAYCWTKESLIINKEIVEELRWPVFVLAISIVNDFCFGSCLPYEISITCWYIL